MVLSSELTIPFHTVLHQTKLNSTLSHRILFLRLASPEQHTLYVTLSSYLSSTIICPPQNPLAVIVLMFELLLCDINVRILLKTFQVLRLVQLGQWMFPTHHCKLWLNCNSSAHRSTWNILTLSRWTRMCWITGAVLEARPQSRRRVSWYGGLCWAHWAHRCTIFLYHLDLEI